MPSPPPLETTRARFRACSLSLTNAPCGARGARTRRAPLHDTHAGPLPVTRGGRTGKRCRRRHLLAPSSGRSHFFVLQDQGEVCTLSGGVMSRPLSAPFQGGLRLLPHPLPASASVGLATPLPRRGRDGFTTFRRRTGRRGGRVSTPGERHLRAASSEGRSLSPCPFGPGLSAPLACPH